MRWSLRPRPDPCANQPLSCPSATTSTTRGWSSATARLRRSGSPRTPTATGCGAFSTICRLESRLRRFFTPSEPSDAILQRLADARDPSEGLTLIVDRYLAAQDPSEAVAARQVSEPGDRDDRGAAGVRPIATASYLKVNDRAGRGRLRGRRSFSGQGPRNDAAGAARGDCRPATGSSGSRRSTLPDNTAMLEVFRDSGFEIRSKTAAGCVDVQLSLTPSAEGVRTAEERDRAATAASLRPLLAPASGGGGRRVARSAAASAGACLDALVAAGFNGPVYPVNPHVDRARWPALLCIRRATCRRHRSRGHRRAGAACARRRRRVRAPPA